MSTDSRSSDKSPPAKPDSPASPQFSVYEGMPVTIKEAPGAMLEPEG
jgi:hypothetical protein